MGGGYGGGMGGMGGGYGGNDDGNVTEVHRCMGFPCMACLGGGALQDIGCTAYLHKRERIWPSCTTISMRGLFCARLEAFCFPLHCLRQLWPGFRRWQSPGGGLSTGPTACR